MTKWQKQVKAAVSDTTIVIPDKVICRGDGSVELRRNFFYAGDLEEQFLAATLKALCLAGLDGCKVNTMKYRRNWPNFSYVAARIYPNS